MRARSALHPGYGAADDPDPRQRQRLEVDRAERGQQTGLDGEDFCPRIAQHVLQREAASGGVERHRHCAGPGAAQDEGQEFGTVAAQQRNAVARRYAGVKQRPGMTSGDGGRRSLAQQIFLRNPSTSSS